MLAQLWRRLIVLGAVVSLVTAMPLLARAQQPTQEPSPPWTQGRPADLATSPLRPHPSPPIAKPANDIPADKIKLPPGFQISIWADGMPNARSIAVGDKGTVFVGSRVVGNVYAVVDKGDRREVKLIAKELHRPNGVAFKDGALYVAELSRLLRFDQIEDRLDNPPSPVVVFDKLPKDEPHGWKFLALGPDGKLYFNIGAPCNICDPPPTHAHIVRINTDGSGFEVFANGVRNSVGMDWHPVTKELYFTDNGRDWMGDDVPNDELNHAPGAACISATPIATRAMCLTQSTAMDVPAVTLQRHSLSWVRTLRPWACDFTLAACSRRSSRIAFSSPSAARGTVRRRRASSSCR